MTKLNINTSYDPYSVGLTPNDFNNSLQQAAMNNLNAMNINLNYIN